MASKTVMLMEQDTTQDPSQEGSSAGSVEKKDTMLRDVQSRHPHANRETNSPQARCTYTDSTRLYKPNCSLYSVSPALNQ